MKITLSQIAKYYNLGNIARILKTLPPLHSPVMDLIYPESKRMQWQSSIIPISELADLNENVPVVRRGTSSYSVGGGNYSADFIEPQPIYLNRFTSAKDILDILATGMESNMNSYLSTQLDILRRRTRRATEIMCAQTLNGKIQYKMQTENGGLVDYLVDYGTVPSLSEVDITSATAGTIYKYFEALDEKLIAEGYSGNILHFAGPDVYARLVSLAADSKNTTIIADEKGILIAGKFRVTSAAWSYKLPGAETATAIIDSKTVQALDLDAPFGLWYCALDDLDNNLAALPLVLKPKVVDDPDGVKNTSNSKPLPVPVLKAMVKQKMLP